MTALAKVDRLTMQVNPVLSASLNKIKRSYDRRQSIDIAGFDRQARPVR
ncbi:hypothetical protein DLJ82_5734 (plasmid) [Rhizobium leguminosarum]|uniref:Uncharacterized protein n=1 Tax=Rhizobium leguminosarum TaxID=384 RepID=A0A2Z4YSG7_RHILE|nr:hypothetical protein DLJ82_5734 [Rhizobium leguminosarum]